MNDRKLVFLSAGGSRNIETLLQHSGWDVVRVSNVGAARSAALDNDCGVGVVLIEHPASNWLSELKDLLADREPFRWIALIGDRLRKDTDVCELIADYFFDYQTLPVDSDRLLITLGHAHGMVELQQQIFHAKPISNGTSALLGECRAMCDLRQSIAKLATIEETVLITGENGTGKELVAQAIHDSSPRSGQPLIAVNCAALPASLVQSELFGYEKGAFTGANKRKIGRIEAASGGTVFLDEIGDLNPDVQVTLLRFLEQKTIERLGDNTSIPVDVRVIAATHVDLKAAMEQGPFREDLFYRLNVVRVHLPPLRDRQEDIAKLADHFLHTFAERSHNRRIKGFSKEARSVLAAYSWPGNVRELKNCIQHAVIMCEHKLVSVADLGLERRHQQRHLVTLQEARTAAEKHAIHTALQHARYNVVEAAKSLKVSRATFYRLMEKHEVGCQAPG